MNPDEKSYNVQNLTPFQKGVSGNPTGKRGKKNRSTIIKKWMTAQSTGKNPVTGLEDTLSQEDWIIIAMIGQARKGNVRAAEFLLDGKYGPLLKLAALGQTGNPDNEPVKDSYISFEIVDPKFEEITDLEISANQ
jgi:hypothetical protein